ncbi:MAG: hypothetical protein PHP93_03540, partial [Kiritimatiellales bacterium]|nr:hypothetical protein [Kiritimatiellales bacterium]
MINMTRISRLNPAPLNVLLACIAIESSATSQAALIASDSFATQAGGAPSYYVEGSLDSGTAQNPTVGVSGFSGAWDAINGSTAAVQAQDSISLTHAMSPGTALAGSIRGYYMAGTVARRVSRALTSAPAVDGTYYMSVLLKKTVTSGGNLYAGLGPSESYTLAFASSGATLIGLDGGAISFYSGGSTTTLLDSGRVTANETYLALLEFDYSTTGADSVTVTLYDGSSVQQASQTFSGLNLDMSHLTLAVTSYSPTEAIDEFRFGSQLSDVISDSIAITAADTYILPFGETSISNAASVLDNDLFATSALLVS